MTRYITTKDTAKLVRAGLKNAFPGVKFSVRMNTGTASAWLDVSWNDGPTHGTCAGSPGNTKAARSTA